MEKYKSQFKNKKEFERSIREFSRFTPTFDNIRIGNVNYPINHIKKDGEYYTLELEDHPTVFYFHSEWNEFGQKVLSHHFPEAEGHGDIKAPAQDKSLKKQLNRAFSVDEIIHISGVGDVIIIMVESDGNKRPKVIRYTFQSVSGK